MAKQFLIKNTMADMRNLCARELTELQDGYYSGIQLLGYYQAGDTPNPINYYLSSTTDPDDGGSVIAIGSIKLEHKFTGPLDVRYFGAQVATNINAVFDKAKLVTNHLLIDDQYSFTTALVINKSDFKLELTSKCVLQKTSLANGNGIEVANATTGVVIVGQGTILGNMNSTRVGYAIAVGDVASNGRVEGIRMDGWTGGILLNYKNRRWTFTLNSFYNMSYVPTVNAGGYGIVFQESYDTLTTENYFDETVERHHIYYAINTGLSVKGGENHVLSNNIFRMQNKTEYSTGFEYSVKIMAAKNVTCTANVLEGGLGGFWVTSFSPNDGTDTLVIDSDTINITGNTIRGLRKGNSGYGAAIGSHGSFTKVRNLDIIGNTIADCECGRADIDLGRVINCNISNNVIDAKEGTNFGIYSDIVMQNVNITDNIISNHLRGIYLLKNSTNQELPCKNIKIANNQISSVNFCVFQQNGNYESTFDIQGNSLETSSGAPIYIFKNTKDLKINDNLIKNKSTSSNITLGVEQLSDSYIYDNIYIDKREIAINNQGTGLVLYPININNIACRLADVPTTSSRSWLIGDKVIAINPINSDWVRITNGTSNVKGTDWIMERPKAETSIYGFVKESSAVPNSTLSAATDLSSVIALANDLKTILNAKLQADRNSGQQAS